MSSGTALGLFPAPQRVPKLQIQTGRKDSGTGTPESLEHAKAPGNTHELVIQVNSVPMADLPPPPPAHFAGGPASQPHSNDFVFFPLQTSTAAGQDVSRAASPAVSDLRAMHPNQAGPSGFNSRSATPAVSEGRRAASPGFSDAGSATLVRSNSGATQRSPRTPVMRSMFPTYNTQLPLELQQYRPYQVSPTHLPAHLVSKQPQYSPTFNYTPHGQASGSGSGSQAVQPSTAEQLVHLWNATNGQTGFPSAQQFYLPLHRHAPSPSASNPSRDPEQVFGPSADLPFYSLSKSLPLSSPKAGQRPTIELLIRRHHPTNPSSIPIAHLALTPPPSQSQIAADSPSSPASHAPTEDTSVLVATILPKQAALDALDVAAQSPVATQIAAVDPDASSAAARRLAEDAVRGASEQEGCALLWSEGTYLLEHPNMGVFPIKIEGMPRLTTNSDSPQLGNSRSVISLINPFAEAADHGSGSAYLAKLELGSSTGTATGLHIDNEAIMAMRNYYLVDVSVATLFAVAIAEERRAKAAGLVFEAPPTSPIARATTLANERAKRLAESMESGDKSAKTHGGWFGKAKSKVSELDLEAQKPVKKDEEEMPPLAQMLLTGLALGFKALVFLLGMLVKILAQLVVTATRCIAKA